MVAKRFRFDVEIYEVMKTLAHRRARTRAAGLRRTKNSKPHDQSVRLQLPAGWYFIVWQSGRQSRSARKTYFRVLGTIDR